MPPLESSRAIILHLTKHGDSGVIVHTLDSESGRKSYYLRGLGKNRKAQLSNLHPLSIVDIVSSSKPGTSISHIKEYSSLTDLSSIRSNILKNSIAIFMSEVLYRSILEHEGDQHLFEWLCSSIITLENCPLLSNYHLRFLVELSARLGFCPQSSGVSCDNIGHFNISSASFNTLGNDSFISQDFFCEEDSIILYNMLSLPFEEAMQLPLNGSARNRFAREMLRYISHHLGRTIEAKSLSILHDIFN
jgi:DNA repair protein RecO (recombination protein O)